MKMNNFSKWANEGNFVTENCFNLFRSKYTVISVLLNKM